MKKKIVFIIPSLDAGGGEKSLVNLLNTIDYSRFEIDLVLFSQTGLFLKLIPNDVNLVSLGENHDVFSKSVLNSFFHFLFSGKIHLAFHRLFFAFKNNMIKNNAIAEQKSWIHKKRSLQRLNKNYDVAIAFLEKSSIYFCVDKVKANKKVGFIHNDYDKLGLNKKLDFNYFKNLDSIVTVSEECESVLKMNFPDFEHKISVMYNIISEKLINYLAKNTSSIEIDKNALSILSIGRLHPQKGFDIAVEACAIIKQRGYNVKWYIIGEGNERNILENKIKKFGLEQNFYLLGLRENPYPYLKETLIYAQTSRFEGKSIAIDEAKIMKKPIVATNFTTVKDQIINNSNGIIVEIDAQDIAEGIIKLIEEPEFRTKLISNLALENLTTESEIEKLYQLFDRENK